MGDSIGGNQSGERGEVKFMGIDFSHCKASWAYSGFGNFRRELWILAGFSGDLYQLYYSGGYIVAKDHPLWPLFNHSDCDGVMTPQELEKVIPALEALIPKLTDDYDRRMGGRLLDGMKLALSRNEDLQFK